MKIWVDAQLSPAIAPWIKDTFGIEAFAVRDIGLRDAEDVEIFIAARNEQVLEIRFGDNTPATGIALTDQMVLYLDRKQKRAVSLTLLHFQFCQNKPNTAHEVLLWKS